MCGTNVQSKIDTVVSDFVARSQSFTAYDITLVVQDQLKADGSFDASQHRHRHLKNDIHRALQAHISNGSYERTLESHGAWQYTPVVVSQPQNDDSVATPQIALDPVNQTQWTDLSTPKVTTPVVKSVRTKNPAGVPDARGTLTVPASLLKQLGVTKKDQVLVVDNDYNSDFLDIIRTDYKDMSLVTSKVTKYTVDPSGNVRITKNTLSRNNLKDKMKFEFISHFPGIRVKNG